MPIKLTVVVVWPLRARFCGNAGSTSLVVQALLTTGLLLAVGRFQQLFELAIFAEWLFYLITSTTIFYYRRKLPKTNTYHVWGYPVVPALFVAAAAILLYYSYAENLKNSIIGSAIILLGIPLYWFFFRNQSSITAEG